MTLNEIGDFLAGVFGPLAIFWIVLGFFQQGEELKNSVATLQLQAKELANSVDQQRALVDATREQIKFERDRTNEERLVRKRGVQPNFSINFSQDSWLAGDRIRYHLTISNTGQACSSVILIARFCEGGLEVKEFPLFNHGETQKIYFPTHGGREKITKKVNITIRYTDRDSEVQECSWQATPLENLHAGFEIEAVSKSYCPS